MKALCLRLVAVATMIGASFFASSFSANAAGSLSSYYTILLPDNVVPPNPDYDPYAQRTSSAPLVREHSNIVGYAYTFMLMRYIEASSPLKLAVLSYWRGRGEIVPCRGGGTYLSILPHVAANSTIVDQADWFYPDSLPCAWPTKVGQKMPGQLTARDEITFGAPQRRKALDGGEYDASPMVTVRNGVPWTTYHWGYRLGLVAVKSDWNPANPLASPELLNWPAVPSAKEEFELTTLPPPWVEDDVVEYVNRQDFPKQPGGQFFYAVLASDKAALDAVPAWQRTGKAFKSGGYVSVCRFYGGKNGGPNTHFYSADDKECAALKAIPTLSYEGQTFAVNMPMPGSNADGTKPCPTASKPLYRLYNNASAPGKNFVSNHRYVTERADVNAAVAQGWVDEGQVMCVPL